PPLPRSRAPSSTGIAPSTRSASTTPDTGTGLCATGESSSPRARSPAERPPSCAASPTGSWSRCAARAASRDNTVPGARASGVRYKNGMDRETADEIKRHFGVVADGLRSRIQLVAEGLSAFHGESKRDSEAHRREMRTEFDEVKSMIRFAHAELDRRVR